MARKKTSHNDPTLMYVHYAYKLQTMKQAYDVSKEYRVADFVTGFKNLKTVQDTVKAKINEIINELVANGNVEPELVSYINTVKAGILTIFTSWLRYSNEGYDGYALSLAVARTMTKMLTQITSGTDLTCSEVGEFVNLIFQKLGNPRAFDVTEGNEGVCVVKVQAPLSKFSTISATGYTATLQQVLSAENPDQVIGAK